MYPATKPLTTDFDPILEDYLFFVQHSTEKEKDLRFLLSQIGTNFPRKEQLRLLDFGAGTGAFLQELLRRSELHKQMKLQLTLIEPGEQARATASHALRTFLSYPVTAQAHLSYDTPSGFDLIIANHSLYYVEDLVATIAQFEACASPAGRTLINMAGSDNFLVRLWDLGYQLQGKKSPFYRSEDLEKALVQRELNYCRETINYTICFPDTTQNRLKIIRFLFGKRLAEFLLAELLGFFDEFVQDGEIRITTAHFAYTL
jgi:SAM-dependent methyltransferase